MKDSDYPMDKVYCGALTRSGKPCQKRPLIGKTRCRNHGGLSLSGKEHGRYRHGNLTKAAIQIRQELQRLLRQAKQFLRS